MYFAMQLHKNALYMRSDVLHTRQCLGLEIHLAHLAMVIGTAACISATEYYSAGDDDMIEVCITSFNMCFKRAGDPTESEAEVNSTFVLCICCRKQLPFQF